MPRSPTMTFLCALPAALSILLLAAHFLRGGGVFLMACSLASLLLLGVRRRWAGRALQVLLLAGAAEWSLTLVELAASRRAAGEPWHRMAAILGAVALFGALSALLLEAGPARRWFGGRPGEATGAH